MNQGEFIEAVYKNLEEQGFAPVSKAQAERGVKAVWDVIHEQLAAGESVRIAGFGTFSTRVNKPREGRNPQTGEVIHIPETRVAKFTPVAALKKDIADGGK